MAPPRNRPESDEDLFGDVAAEPDEELFAEPPKVDVAVTPDTPPQSREEPAWYDDLPGTVMAAAQGASLNTADEMADWLAEGAGQTMRDAAKKHPVAHGGGQLLTGIGAGLLAAPGLAAQGAAAAAQSGASEYFDSYDPLQTGLATTIGGAVGTGAAALGKVAGKVGGKVASWMRGPGTELVDPAASRILRTASNAPEDLIGAPATLRGSSRPVESFYGIEEVPQGEVLSGARKFHDLGTPVEQPSPLTRSAAPRSIESEVEYEALDPLDELLRPREPRSTDVLPHPTQPMLPRPPTTRAGGKFTKTNYPDADMSLPPETGQGPLESLPPDDLGLRVKSVSTSASRPPMSPAAPLEVPPPAPPKHQLGELMTRRAPMSAVDPIEPPPAMWDRRPVTSLPPAARDVESPIAKALVGELARKVPGGRGALAVGRAVEAMSSWPSSRVAEVATSAAGRASWELGAPELLGHKVNAQDETTAYAGAPTLNYALSATLSSGDTGLEPADQQALTSAVVAGDDRAIAAIDYRLRQRNPAYARRVERELRDLNELD